jgi:WD40 repeat protein
LQAAFDPKGNFAVTAANDGTLRLYSLKGGSPEGPIEMRGHKRAVFALDIAADGTIASGSADGTLRFWRPKSALEVAGPMDSGQSETEWLRRIGYDNLPFVNFGYERIKLPDQITCAWAGSCPNSSE